MGGLWAGGQMGNRRPGLLLVQNLGPILLPICSGTMTYFSLIVP